MATLIFSDGTKKTVKYGLAVTIKDILAGDERTIDEASKEELQLANKTADVLFEAPKQSEQVTLKKGVFSQTVQEVMAMPKLTGKQKFDLIGQRLKGGK